MSAAAFKSREEQRRARELEEARKAGTVPAERDEEGNEINPHIPQFMAQAPWYLNQEAPGLKHQRNLKEQKPVARVTDFVPRGHKAGPAASVYRKGACTNCGAMTHKARDCVERPRKKGAKFTGKDIKSDELIVEMAFDYAGKRDHWSQYDASNHIELLKSHERETELRLQAEQQQKMAQLAAKEQKEQDKQRRKREKKEKKDKEREKKGKAKDPSTGDGDGANEEANDDGSGTGGSDTDTDTDTEGEGLSDEAKQDEAEQLNLGAAVGNARAGAGSGAAKMSVRNLRIREDTAKYLLNLDVNSAYYDPKTRSMRENPLPGTVPGQDMYVGDNFVRASGDAAKLAALQLYEFEAYDKGQNLHLNADPTTIEMMNRIYREKKESLKTNKANTILEKYGGKEHMEAPPKELLFAQTEDYVEYDRSGSLVGGKEKAIAKSKYQEDVLTHNHTSIWGSFFDLATFRWGYADDHSTMRNSYSTGAAGKAARRAASDALARPADTSTTDTDTADAAADKPSLACASGAALSQRALYGVGADLGAETPLDEAKVRAEMAAQKAREKAIASNVDERKRKYNSMDADETTAEKMEAYYRNKARGDDPMANFQGGV
mmetsp:Transcript_35667/g.78383  ORF Transcript_35667/g.78383 Transcript_35667/m.78383 type:complete len:606 (+) Transcript_35667:424-2241(+)